MIHVKYLSNSDKALHNEPKGIYTVICNVSQIRINKQVKEDLKVLLGVTNILKINKINYYSKGYVKLIVRTNEAIDWLHE